MGYAVNLVTGTIRPVSERRALSPEQVDGLLGGAELVGIDAAGVMTPVVASLDPSRLTPRSPLLCIRVRRSGSPAFYRGQIFDTIADFDAKVRAVRGAADAEWEQDVDIVIEWKDGASFHARFNLLRDRGEYLHDHVQRVCGEVLRHPMFAPFAPAARITIVRMFVTALAETSARLEDA